MKFKRFSGVLMASALVATVTAGIALAQGNAKLPGTAWYTGHTFANVSPDSGNVVVTAYNAASNETHSWDSTIPSGGSDTFLVTDLSPEPASGFVGSAVGSSDKDMRAIVNVTNKTLGSLGTAGGEGTAQYRGVNTVNTVAAFPLVKYEFPANHPARKNTTLFIQNAGPEATTVTVDFVGTGCSPCSYTTPSIDSNEMVAVVAKDAAGVSDGFIGAATATSDKANVPIAAIFMEVPTQENPVTQAQAGNAFSPDDYDSTINVPVYKRSLGSRSTGLQVQNVGTANVDLTITYKGALFACAGETKTDASKTNIAPGQSVTFLDPSELTSNCLASATVVATVASGSSGTALIAGIVNEAFFPSVPAGLTQQSTTYAAFPEKAASPKVSGPVMKNQFGPKTTGVTCQNVGGATATNVVYKFVIGAAQAGGTSGDTHTSTAQTIAAGAAQTLVNPSSMAIWPSGGALPDKTLNSLTVEADQPIVCIFNESVWATPGNLQDKNNYEGFNLQ